VPAKHRPPAPSPARPEGRPLPAGRGPYRGRRPSRRPSGPPGGSRQARGGPARPAGDPGEMA